MAVRTVPTSVSTPPLYGPVYMDAVAAAVAQLFNVSALPLTTIGGTGNAITAALDPPLTSGLADGMSFWLTPTANNTTAATIAINGASAQAIRDSAGVALPGNMLVAGVQCLITWNATAGHFRILNSMQITKIVNYQAFTASGTWTKPAGTPAGALVVIECVGAGGGGNTSGGPGGGGGGSVRRVFPASAVGSSVAVTIGAGGAAGNPGSQGGASSFGSLVTAYGGGGGSASSAGGGGGGAKGPGLSTGVPGGPAGGATDGASGVGGGYGSTSGSGPGGDGYEGGGGGGRGTAGGSSVYGGGGGGTTGGTSVFSGAGGNTSQAGAAPGGGGGPNAAGARGEVRVWVMG